MSTFVAKAREVAAAVQSTPDVDELAKELAQDLSEILAHYASVLTQHDIPLPYVPKPSTRVAEVLASDWLVADDLRAFLELTSLYAGYDFDDMDWVAITTALDGDPSATTDYPLIGTTELAAHVRRKTSQEDGAHVTVAISGTPDPSLAIRLSTIFTVLAHPSRMHRRGEESVG